MTLQQEEQATSTFEVTCSAPVNIAVIKYWGKRDTALLLPTNSSLSVTLSQDHLQSKTTVRVSTASDSSITRDRIWLNGKEENAGAKRLANVLGEVRRIRREMEAKDSSLPKLAELPIHIASENNFPTAAGLASSASGFACLTFALSKLFALNISTSDVSRMARVGSGSACRSLFGGFVAWNMGSETDGSDSVAVQVAPETHWPNMSALILVASDARKDTGSTEGMQLTVETSALLTERINNVVPERMKQMEEAIASKNFDLFAEVTMKDSNQFHAVCLDTYPPIFYMNDVSKGIISFITAYNKACAAIDEEDNVPAAQRRKYRVAYTYDAGPNAVLYLLQEDAAEVLQLANRFFPPPQDHVSEEYYGRAATLLAATTDKARLDRIEAKLKCHKFPAGSLRRIIGTHVGDGPRLLSSTPADEVSLIGADGLPKRVVVGKKAAEENAEDGRKAKKQRTEDK
ncbi:diphosphomevalonate decarboxylase [Phlyctochytrium bullatum]|nr:diphosphomevalonate decarboxylase [Phlyctochytrium bullatum]